MPVIIEREDCQSTQGLEILVIIEPEVCQSTQGSSLAKVPIRFSPLPLGGFRQVFKHSGTSRRSSLASSIWVLYGF